VARRGAARTVPPQEPTQLWTNLPVIPHIVVVHARGLHSPTVRLDVSTTCGYKYVEYIEWFHYYKTAQIEVRSGGVEAPSARQCEETTPSPAAAGEVYTSRSRLVVM